MNKLIVTILLMIGGVVASLAVFNGFYPGDPVDRGSQSAVSSAQSLMVPPASGEIQGLLRVVQGPFMDFKSFSSLSP